MSVNNGKNSKKNGVLVGPEVIAKNTNGLSVKEIPIGMRNSYILSGYRPLGASFTTTCKSLFELHNETFNIWTHLLPIIYFGYFIQEASVMDLVKNRTVTEILPLYAYFLGIFALFMGSCGAHLFGSVSLTWNSICFMVDYMGIGLFGTGTCACFYYYNYPEIPLLVQEWENIYIIAGVSFGVLSVWVSCVTTSYHSPICYVIRTVSFTLAFAFGSMPAAARFIVYVLKQYFPEVANTTKYSHITPVRKALHWLPIKYRSIFKTAMLVYKFRTVGGDALQNYDTEFRESSYCFGYLSFLIYMCSAAMFQCLRLPECIFPERFDIFAHSHQWFHILVFMGVRENFWLTISDFKTYIEYPDQMRSDWQHQILFKVIAVYLVISVSLIAVVVWYGFKAKTEEKKTKEV